MAGPPRAWYPIEQSQADKVVEGRLSLELMGLRTWLALRADWDTGIVRVHGPTLGRALGMSTKKAARLLRELTLKGEIVRGCARGSTVPYPVGVVGFKRRDGDVTGPDSFPWSLGAWTTEGRALPPGDKMGTTWVDRLAGIAPGWLIDHIRPSHGHQRPMRWTPEADEDTLIDAARALNPRQMTLFSDVSAYRESEMVEKKDRVGSDERVGDNSPTPIAGAVAEVVGAIAEGRQLPPDPKEPEGDIPLDELDALVGPVEDHFDQVTAGGVRYPGSSPIEKGSLRQDLGRTVRITGVQPLLDDLTEVYLEGPAEKRPTRGLIYFLRRARVYIGSRWWGLANPADKEPGAEGTTPPPRSSPVEDQARTRFREMRAEERREAEAWESLPAEERERRNAEGRAGFQALAEKLGGSGC